MFTHWVDVGVGIGVEVDCGCAHPREARRAVMRVGVCIVGCFGGEGWLGLMVRDDFCVWVEECGKLDSFVLSSKLRA